jgi:hypothetical protein
LSEYVGKPSVSDCNVCETSVDVWYLNKNNKIRGSQQMRFLSLFTGLSLAGHVLIKGVESTVKHAEKYRSKSIPLVE